MLARTLFLVALAGVGSAASAVRLSAAASDAAPVTAPLPVTPDALPEAVELLRFLHENSGRHTLAGQHCNPLVGSTRLVLVQRQTGRYPAVFGQDFGFDRAGAWDGINFRQNIVDEAIRRHHEGFIITLMWHAVPPDEDEPVEFLPSIQSELTDEQWRELLTPGSMLHERWKSQVDVIAWFLKQLQFASVPVLWRPYHEMNGGWFWWGGRPGPEGYAKLYRMLYDRFVHFHGLRNLLWVFNANEVREGIGAYADYYPGADVVDILATDVYRGGFASHDYTDLLALADGKPIALGEVGSPPEEAKLREQPRWSWFMIWGDTSGQWRDIEGFRSLFQSEEVTTLDELPWAKFQEPRIHYPVAR